MILHLDMDAFFAAIEQRDNPALRGKPIAVGGTSDRSVVSTASYEARKYGIHSAMPMFQAKKKCPDLIIVPGHRTKYSDASRQIMAILNEYSPLVEPVSIDEAYMDISGCSRLFGTHLEMAHAIKKRIKDQLHLTCSIGIAPLKYMAKIASDIQKPDGITIIKKEQAQAFAMALDIKKIPGVGKRALSQLQRLNIHTLGDIHRYEAEHIVSKFGKFGLRLVELANGIDQSRVESRHIRKSISKEVTLSHDTTDPKYIREVMLSLSQSVGRTLRRKKMVCANVFIKLKFSDFSQITRTHKLNLPVCSSKSIYDEAVRLFENVTLKKRVRLIGVGVSSLQDESVPVQMELLGNGQTRHKQWERVDEAVDMIMDKFGSDLVKKATLNPSIKE